MRKPHLIGSLLQNTLNDDALKVEIHSHCERAAHHFQRNQQYKNVISLRFQNQKIEAEAFVNLDKQKQIREQTLEYESDTEFAYL